MLREVSFINHLIFILTTDILDIEKNIHLENQKLTEKTVS